MGGSDNEKNEFLLLISLLFLGACEANEQEEHEQVNGENTGVIDEEDVEKPSTMPELEETKTVDMLIEGTTEEKVVKLHHHEQLGFSTYVPDDMVVEFDDQTFNVYTNFQGAKNEDARLFMMKKTEKEISEDLESEGFTLTEGNESSYEFSEKEYRLEKAGFSGRVFIFTQSNESYILGYYYPSEYGDGFSARTHIILDELVWHNE